MKSLLILLIAAFLLPARVQATFGLDECLLKGWVNDDRQVPFTLHILYERDKKDRFASKVVSATLEIDGQKTVFPRDAFDGLGSMLGTPSGVVRHGTKDGYLVYFINCGDGARSFSLDFAIRGGVLRERRLIPRPASELDDKVRLYDVMGRITYDGPCDRQGNPTKKPQH
jgi:hypothetical protein